MRLTYLFRGLIFLLFFPYLVNAQVGIGNTDPDPSALLDVRDDANPNKGILIPQVNIPDLNAAAPVVSPKESLLVYNTNTTTGPGYVFWNGLGWEAFGTGGAELYYEENSFLNGSPQLLNDQNGFPQSDILYTYSITVSKPTLIEVNTAVELTVQKYAAGRVDSGKAILYGMYLTRGALQQPGTEYLISEQKIYSSALDGTFFPAQTSTLGGSGFIELSAGTHDLTLYGVAMGGGQNHGFYITFHNDGGSYFRVIKHN